MGQNKIKTIIISVVIILLVGCSVFGVILASGLGIALFRPFRTETGEDVVSTQVVINTNVAPSSTPGPMITEDRTPIPTQELPADLTEMLTDIETQVMRLRGLSTSQNVVRTLISMDELEDIVANDFFSEYSDEDARKDTLALSLLGLIPEGFDLKSLYTELYSEQIAGFYDDETKQIYVVQGVGFGGSEKLTYSHEFTHVLQDQTYDFENGLGYNDDMCEADSEKCAAIQSLIEGDASLTEILWFQTYATQEDYDDLLEMFNNLETPVLDSAPEYITADLYFPYEKGLAFVQYLYEEGGYPAVDGAYQDSPLSTEQILHPERYPSDIPTSVTLPDFGVALGGDWVLFDQNVMGEWYTFLILNKAFEKEFQLSEGTALAASEGWGGDAYAFYLNESTDDVVFILDSVWDTSGDAEEFGEGFIQYADLRWGESENQIMDLPAWEGSVGISVFLIEGDRTLWVMAPSEDLISQILSELR